MTAVPRSRARKLHRLAQRQGDICGTVDDTGVRFTTAHSSAGLDWHLYPRYGETPELFVLLSADKSAVGFVVLPKRAVADPEDVDRLRAALDRRLVRADAAEAPGSPRSRGRGRAVGRGAGSIGLLLLGLLLFFFAFAAVQTAAHPDRFPGIQNNTVRRVSRSWRARCTGKDPGPGQWGRRAPPQRGACSGPGVWCVRAPSAARSPPATPDASVVRAGGRRPSASNQEQS
ncbi:YcxB family protein [Streptomyces sp. NPDC007896]|uniref:YcxB family protein n=1 Tax=Streptomyces sp. NPDC007896 TaxID=3364784 RepID=UPI0036E0E36B